ncbi:MAG: FkbM family methyltransferase [Sulfurimonas sp.]|nr:FkbM family methyltransferase [Sulfurimonas sp.]MDD3834162.1 FkbM family methyltransferase [Sulfurimonas sp.]
MKTIHRLQELATFKKIAIYGAGHAGEVLYHTLKNFLPNTKTIFIIDDFKTGKIDNIPIISSKELKNQLHNIQAILVSVLIKEEIEKTLLKYDVASFYVRINYFQNIEEIDTIIDKKNIHKTHNFTKKTIMHEKEKEFELVKNLLHKQEDKELYELILQGWLNDPMYMEKFFCNNYHSIGRHYFEFIIPQAIYTVIEGGIADGTNTIEMLNTFSPSCKIYGFDPIFEKYSKEDHKRYIKGSKRVEISQKGLWNKETHLAFITDKNLALSRVVEDQSCDHKNNIEVTTIDNFTKENDIKKIDFIKFDIEGAELEALQGGICSIKKDRPQMALSIYHKFEHLYEIALFLMENLEDYTYRLGHYHYELGESVLYAIPNELYAKYKDKIDR